MCWRMCVCALDVCVPIHVREGVCECVCVRVSVISVGVHVCVRMDFPAIQHSVHSSYDASNMPLHCSASVDPWRLLL